MRPPAYGPPEGAEGQIASARLDRLTEWLEMTLGVRLTAYAAGVDSMRVHRIAHGEESPDAATETRLRNLYAVAWMLAARDGAGTAYTWLTEPNADLGDRPPVELLHAGARPEAVWFAASPTF